MLLKDYLPNFAFREYIQCFNIVHFEFDKNIETPFKADPSKPQECLRFSVRHGEEIELFNSQRKDYQLPVALIGQQTSAMKIYVGKKFFSSPRSLSANQLVSIDWHSFI